MSLADWRVQGHLREHRTSPQEIDELLRAVDRDLQDCKTAGLSADWRLAIAHNAARGLATAALAAEGYRPGREAHHYWVLQSLSLTLGLEPHVVAELDAFRKKRNLGEYERVGAVSDSEVDRAVELALRLREQTVEWLRAKHPHLLAKP